MENHIHSTQPQSQSSAGDLRDGTVVGGQRRGKFGKCSHSGRVTGKCKFSITDDLSCVCSCKADSTSPLHLGMWSQDMAVQVAVS